MKHTYYFSHDYNARTDTKIKKLLSKHGFLGYGIFWAIVEDLYNNANALPLDCESIAFDLRTDIEVVNSVIHDFGLFSIEGSTFGSLSVERRLNERNEKSRKAKESAVLRWDKHRQECERIAGALPSDSDSNANKGKERKRKEKKETNDVDELVLIHPLQVWIKDTLPNVSKLKTQITEAQAKELTEKYHKKLIQETLEAMENYKDIEKKYTSVYLTLLNWMKKRQSEYVLPDKWERGTVELTPFQVSLLDERQAQWYKQQRERVKMEGGK